MNPIKDENLYTNSIYKEIFDEAKVPFITPDKMLALISEKEERWEQQRDQKGRNNMENT